MDKFQIFRSEPIRNTRSCKLVNDPVESYRPLLAVWLIEMALAHGWHKKRSINKDFCILETEPFARITGISVEIDEDSHIDGYICIGNKIIEHTDSACARVLKQYLDKFRKQPIHDELALLKNICTIGKILGLNDAEMGILCFAAAMQIFPAFNAAISSVSFETTQHSLGSIIALVTGQKQSEVMAALREGSTLISSGIVEVEYSNISLEHKFSLLSGLGEILSQTHENEEALLRKFLKKADAPSLSLSDFPHLAQDVQAIKIYLSEVLRKQERGTNILFYGVPGTGKTECVKALAISLGVDLYEISFANEVGNPISGTDRLRAYTLCQRVLRSTNNAILMFDEIEDVFPGEGEIIALFGFDDSDRKSNKSLKAWINRTLEHNHTPAIWITNDACIDPSYLRRFDYSVRFSIPPQKVRMEIARHHFAQFDPPEHWLSHIASSEQMIPSQYERAAKVARLSCNGDMEQARLLVEQVLDRSASLLGQKIPPARNMLHTSYDLRFVNTSMSAEKIIAGLARKPRGTFCFYGPPGTGKSEFARHIADQIGKPILVRRASDILSKWVGEAEQNIAEMFSEARQQESILVLDEADSFLADRRDSSKSWEVSQVNELLTQMEAFEGMFICTTNLLEKLDQASLRRFVFKVRFDYLTASQRWEMFKSELARQGCKLASAGDWKQRVQGLEKLTPGDFSVAARQFEVMGVQATPNALFQQLQEECRVKGGGKNKIGFIS